MADKKEKKEKTVWGSLLLIPIQFLISMVILFIFIRMDVILYSNIDIPEGHAVPAYTMLGIFIALALFIIVTVISIVISISRASRNKKARKKAELKEEIKTELKSEAATKEVEAKEVEATPAEEKPAEEKPAE